MTHFAVFAPPLRGHYRPLSFLAEELIARGHRITFVHQEEARGLVEAEGANFCPVGLGAEPVSDWTRPMARIRGLVGLGPMMRRMERFTTMLCREAPAALRSVQVDAVISDQLEPAGGLVADHLDLPLISTATTLPMNREMGIPPPFVGWSFDPSEAGRRRNEGGWRVTDLLLRRFNRVIAGNAAKLGLGPRQRMEDCFSTLLTVAQTVPSIDFPRKELPATFHYTGPFRSARRTGFELPPSLSASTAYCTLGTLQGSRIRLFRRLARACARKDIRLVITTGGAKGLAAGKLAGDTLVYDWLPQEDIMAEVDMVVSHAGMNSVLDPLAAGIPMVVMPLAFEQPGIAARVAGCGAGVRISRTSGIAGISKALERVRNDPDFRYRAQAIQKEIRQAGGAPAAADLIERTLGVGARPEASTRARAARDDARGGSRSDNS